MQQQIIGLIAIGVGFSMVYKTRGWTEFLGRNDWAEDKLGPGGTQLFYKLIGTGICILGIFGVTGILDGFVYGIASTVFIGAKPQ